jgi:hypothetical protein
MLHGKKIPIRCLKETQCFAGNKNKNELRGLSSRANYTDGVKLLPTSAGTACHVISVTDPYGRILGFLDRNHYLFFQVAP